MEAHLVLPEGWDDLAAFEVESKGWFDALIVVGDREFDVSFYDPVRLAQDVEADLAAGEIFVVRNLIVVNRVTVEEMTRAVCVLRQAHLQ